MLELLTFLTQLLRNWCEKRPSNKSDLEPSVTKEVESPLRRGVLASDLVLYHSTILFWA